jgi:hypothetical protein
MPAAEPPGVGTLPVDCSACREASGTTGGGTYVSVNGTEVFRRLGMFNGMLVGPGVNIHLGGNQGNFNGQGGLNGDANDEENS